MAPWGVLEVVVEGEAPGRHLGMQTEGANHVHSLTAGNGILLGD